MKFSEILVYLGHMLTLCFSAFAFVPLYHILIPLPFWYLACPKHILQSQWLYD